MTGGPAELEGVAAGWGKATDCSEGAAELAVCRTSLEGLGTKLVYAKLVLSGQLSPDPFGSLPDNDISLRKVENCNPSGLSKESEMHPSHEQMGLGTSLYSFEAEYSYDLQLDLLSGDPTGDLMPGKLSD